MSGRRCLEPGELADHAAWVVDDPRRTHVERCARCQALLASYRLFETPPDDLPPERRAAARARLSAARRAWAAGEPAPRAMRAPHAPWWWPGPGFSRLRPAFAFAAVVVAAGAALWATGRWPGERAEHVLRARDTAAPAAVTVLPPARVADALELRWRAVPEADDYEVTLFDATLARLSRHPAGADTALRVVPPAAAGDAGGAVYWQVTARRGGDVLAESPPVPLAPGDPR